MQGTTIRNAVRAIIIEDGKILLCKYRDNRGELYACVGGGQACFEDMHTALRRECREEINHEITIGNLVYVREAIFETNDGSDTSETIHQIESFFQCTLIDPQGVYHGNHPDNHSLGIEWVAIDKLKDVRIYPSVFRDILHKEDSFQDTVYLGLSDD